MERLKQALEEFMAGIEQDPRICLSHIGVFSVLLHSREEHGGVEPFPIHREQIMKTAKISSTATYFKIIRQLHEYGYIFYQPTFNRMSQSKVGISRNVQTDNHKVN
ncbi:hypothetical protein LV84_03658 [Algoriphagus ratkowskyi]|uniref:Uncharacterized protein n=1 Tax=Algoriphagus ratkowskyi TaxID=57028 RepID=A0A2W7QU37_9BACT|nr:hypothetical protein [Algoriphagus ratkowskyi]PZX51501.1 hypothetical protein LV84_03658 [Algoriphagus ratkowskyi]TXD78784.1 hypothetical protein ESW18_04485 [Algoriphagus ratkowskyi]